MRKVLILNGPNLNMLGNREPKVYGTVTLGQINDALAAQGKSLQIEPVFFQSNSEGALIDKIHAAANGIDGIIINAGAYTHYSYAIADALGCVACPKIEVHLSNIFAREEFRHHSVLSPVCNGVICGFGADVYALALTQMANLMGQKK